MEISHYILHIIMLISIVKFLSTGLPLEKKTLTIVLYTKMMLEACPTKYPVCKVPICKENPEEDGRAFNFYLLKVFSVTA